VDAIAGLRGFLIIDNGPCHRLNDEGRRWLGKHSHAIELYRLLPYSPELNPIEGVWKTTRREAVHNRFFLATAERDASLRRTFVAFKRHPRLIDGHLARFRRFHHSVNVSTWQRSPHETALAMRPEQLQ
jgi:DDE superfamily endonuclease